MLALLHFERVRTDSGHSLYIVWTDWKILLFSKDMPLVVHSPVAADSPSSPLVVSACMCTPQAGFDFWRERFSSARPGSPSIKPACRPSAWLTHRGDIAYASPVVGDQRHGFGSPSRPRRQPQHPSSRLFHARSAFGGPDGEPQGSPVPLCGLPVFQPVWTAASIGFVTAVDQLQRSRGPSWQLPRNTLPHPRRRTLARPRSAVSQLVIIEAECAEVRSSQPPRHAMWRIAY